MFRHFSLCFEFSNGVSDQVWYLIVSIPDLSLLLLYFFGSDRPKEKNYNSTLQPRQLIIDNSNFRSLLEHRHLGQWLSGRVLDLRLRVFGFEPHLRHCIVPLSKNINLSLVLVQPRDRSLITERLLMGRKVSNQTKTKIKSLGLVINQGSPT